MVDDRSDAMNISAFEREIETALAVDPSPEFLARVRLRIASEPASSAWRIPWVFIAGSVAMAIVMAVVVLRSDRKLIPTSVDQPPDAITGDARATVTETALVPVVEAAPAAPQSNRTSSSRPVREVRPDRDPEVLISADEAAGLRRLIAAVRDRRIDFTSVLVESPQATAWLQPVSEITWSSIAIEPLEPITTEEGVRQ